MSATRTQLAVVNVAAYRFGTLTDLPALRAEFKSLCEQHRLRGTILLSTEGINLFLAGSRDGIDAIMQRVRALPGFETFEGKESFSEDQPFNRLLVKLKKEIIPFGVESVDPRKYTSKRLEPRQLKQWLDEGRPVTLLDTRNDYEVEIGTFDNAIPIGVDEFRDFPDAVGNLPEELKTQPVVAFCTGGIRCEKATPFLEQQGFREVYQLEGGILKYFEECGGDHYHGDCFVFDLRVAVNAALEETEHEQCFACQAIVTPEEQQSPQYVVGQSCPHCYQTEAQQTKRRIEQRQREIDEAITPLPGSIPYDNIRPLNVPLRCDGMELLDFLDEMKTHLSRDDWQRVCEQGRLLYKDEPVMPGRFVRSGERLEHLIPATREPDVNANIVLLHEDDALIVVEKPAPLPMHPCGRFNKNSLTGILNQVYEPMRPRPAHRLDADTSGIVVFSKKKDYARHLQQQFDRGTVTKRYLARVIGSPEQDRFECDMAISATPGPQGIRVPDPKGLPSQTRFKVIERFPDGTTLLEVEPVSGRTNQIRVHLWSLGLPILGEGIYLPDGQLGSPGMRSPNDPRLCLQANLLEFDHPITGERMRFEASLPDWSE